MDLATVLDALVTLLAAGSLGFLAYGGWLCVRHATRLDGSSDPARHASRTQSPLDRKHATRRPIALD